MSMLPEHGIGVAIFTNRDPSAATDILANIVEREGFRVEFRRGPDGAVYELIFHQPNGTFMARRTDAGVSGWIRDALASA